MRERVIATMQLLDGFVVKTRRYGESTYIGDPINTVKIFNDKGVDELVIVDVSARRGLPVVTASQIEDIATEAFMPVAYGGGIKSYDQVRSILSAGVEKVIFGSGLLDAQETVTRVAQQFGVQAVVGAIDVRFEEGTHRPYPGGGGRPLDMTAVEWSKRACELGVGELFVTNMDLEGDLSGYDLDLIRQVSAEVPVPVIANGGAGSVKHFRAALEAGASAVAAGSMFTFYGPHRAVLITYPTEQELDEALSSFHEEE